MWRRWSSWSLRLVGDKLMVVCNSYYYDKCELLNGDIITVVETSNDIISQSAPIWTEKNGRKVKEIITLDFREISFRNVIAFVEYEFYPLANPSAGNLARLKEELFDQVDIDPANIYCPDGSMPKDAILDFCRQYEETIQSVLAIILVCQFQDRFVRQLTQPNDCTAD